MAGRDSVAPYSDAASVHLGPGGGVPATPPAPRRARRRPCGGRRPPRRRPRADRFERRDVPRRARAGAERRPRPRRRRRAPQLDQGLGTAQDPALVRARAADGGPGRPSHLVAVPQRPPQARLAALPQGHTRGDAGHRRPRGRGARRPRADAGRARLRARAHHRLGFRRRGRAVGLGCRAQARGVPRRALLRPRPRAQRHLRPSRPTSTNGRIEVQPFGRLPRRAVDAEIERIRAFR